MIKQFELNGVAYPLDHLQGFRLDIPRSDPLLAPARLQVTFSCHVFSERWDANKHPPERRFVVDSEDRAFCPVRYGCSIGLEEHIRYLALGKAYEVRDGNGIRNHFFYATAEKLPYPIFFRLSQASRIKGVHGLLHIISAYQKPNLKARHACQSIKFARLVHQRCSPKPEL